MPHVGAPPRCETGMPATPPPPADIRTRGGCSYGGFGLLRYVLRRSTALGAKRVCRQLSRRRLAFAPEAGAPAVGSGFSDMFRVGAPPPVRNGFAGNSAAVTFAPGAGAPTGGSGFSDMFRVGAPPPVRNGAAGSSAPLLCGRAGARPSQARSAGAL